MSTKPIIVNPGDTYGQVTIIEEIDRVMRGIKSPRPIRMVHCECDCGTTFDVALAALRSGNTESCGCIHKIQLMERNTTHNGKAEYEKLWNSWRAMKARARSTNGPWKNITIVDEWLDFNTFKAWALSNGYEEGLSIDREDVLGNYEPGNCQWLTRGENTSKGNTIDKERKNEA